MKKNSGFTLIELVVVMAILAILAAVAVPAYSGYIKKANETADQQKIEAVETAMQSALAMEGYDESNVLNHFVMTYDDQGITIKKATAEGADADVWTNFESFYKSENPIKLAEKNPANVVICGKKPTQQTTNSTPSGQQ